MGILRATDFTRIGDQGIGNPRSKIAESLCVFQNRVYVGVTHHQASGPEDAARILCWDPVADSWDTAYESPLVPADELASAAGGVGGPQARGGAGQAAEIADMVPLDRGYPGMRVFQGPGESAPGLCVGTLSNWGARILRSVDGGRFEAVSEPGFGDPTLLSFRSFASFEWKLFVAPAGTVTRDTLDRNFCRQAMIYVSDSPSDGEWKPAMAPGFGDPGNRAIHSMGVLHGHLYAATGNPERGFQIWKTDAQGPPPFEWRPVILDGAGRYNVNELVLTMATFKGALYVGTGLPGFGYDREHHCGPGATELIRIFPDDGWELVMGSPRFSPQGLQVPVSAMGPGFEDPFNSVAWSMTEHDGCFYVGTNNWHAFHIAFSGERVMQGGFNLWATEDGEAWEPVITDGLGNPFSCGAPALLSTPHGLFLGTSSHQEIEPLWRRRSGQPGEARPAAMEVWLARPE